MWLFDIGTLVFLAGFINMIIFFFKRNTNAVIGYVVLEIIGALVMLVAYYIVAGNEFELTKMLS